jgi:tRNA G18 (ribose-2'-O)-methylase SpoU
MAPISIFDPEDGRLDLYRGLPDAALRRRIEGQHGVFVVEGARPVRTLLTSPYPLVSVLLRPERLAGLADVVAAATERGAPVYVAGREVFDRIAGFPVHRGVLALARRLPEADVGALLARVTAAVVVEGVNDHENLGAIFRNAAALGAGAVFLDPTCCDPLYRRSVRVSMAQVLRLPFSRLAPWPDALAELPAAGFLVVALDPGASETIEDVAQRWGTVLVRGPDGEARTGLERPARSIAVTAPRESPPSTRLAVLVGAEGSGLTEGARRAARHRVRIPMRPGVDSLNVATALAIAFHRLIRPEWLIRPE